MHPPLDLLALLADGGFHSGEALGTRLGISRAAVWKRVRALRTLGLTVHAVRGRGYRLDAPVEWLEVERILAALPCAARSHLGRLEIHLVLDSTNAELLRRAADETPNGTVCLAEMQRAGRGRRGRRWHSPPARNLYLSVAWRFDVGPAELGGLSVRLGVAVAEALAALGVTDVGLKWPNDLLVAERKAGGVLVEVQGEQHGRTRVVAGVGLNFGMPRGTPIDQPWADLARAGGGLSRNCTAGRVIGALLTELAAVQEGRDPGLVTRWARCDRLRNRRVRVHWPERVLEGTALGIDASGALLLRLDSGGVRRIASGEVSLRKME